jgi:hypothetical protein
MSQNNRAKPNKHGPPTKQLASINFPKELITYLDAMAEECGINRSSLVCLIIQDFKDSGKKIRFVVD